MATVVMPSAHPLVLCDTVGEFGVHIGWHFHCYIYILAGQVGPLEKKVWNVSTSVLYEIGKPDFSRLKELLW